MLFPLTANHTYKNGVQEGTASGIVEGRKGYVKGYDSGIIPVEGYDGFGWEYDCESAEYYFRESSGIVSEGTLKSNVGYNYNDLKRTWNYVVADKMKDRGESVCRALGYQP